MLINSDVKTVKELTDQIKSTLEKAFPYVWVKGEVGSVKIHSSGHCYFSLKEEDIVINAICWKGTPVSVVLKEGMLVECYAKVTIFGGRSSYQIIAKDIREVSSKGNILLQFEELKNKLIKEGVFDLKSKDSIVEFPKKIAILTSPTGAVFHDMMHRINDRYPCVHILFFPIAVQGIEAQKSILEALNKVEKYSDVDTVILARGGGSLEDLCIFNDELVVRKVASLKLPIISAIGHETDTTLSDYAANLRAPTPTAAIEFCVPDKNELTLTIMNIADNCRNFAYEKINNFENLLSQFEDHALLYSNAIDVISQKFDNLFLLVNDLVKSRIAEYDLILLQEDSFKFLIEKIENDLENLFKKNLEFSNLRVLQAIEVLNKDELFLIEKEKELSEKVIIFDKNNNKIISKNAIKELNFDKFSLNFLDGSIDVIECE